VKKIIKPATEKERCRFIELDEMINNVGNAHTFISYAQAGNNIINLSIIYIYLYNYLKR
jgi:hypothetical protein